MKFLKQPRQGRSWVEPRVRGVPLTPGKKDAAPRLGAGPATRGRGGPSTLFPVTGGRLQKNATEIRSRLWREISRNDLHFTAVREQIVHLADVPVADADTAGGAGLANARLVARRMDAVALAFFGGRFRAGQPHEDTVLPQRVALLAPFQRVGMFRFQARRRVPGGLFHFARDAEFALGRGVVSADGHAGVVYQRPFAAGGPGEHVERAGVLVDLRVERSPEQFDRRAGFERAAGRHAVDLPDDRHRTPALPGQGCQRVTFADGVGVGEGVSGENSGGEHRRFVQVRQRLPGLGLLLGGGGGVEIHMVKPATCGDFLAWRFLQTQRLGQGGGDGTIRRR